MRAPRIWPGNTKAVSPGCLGVTAWRRRCDLHRRTTGGWSQTDRELGIGDVVIAESGDTSALYIGCRNAALKAELSPSAPAGDGLDAMIMSRAIERDRATAGVAGMNAREDSWSSGMLRRAVTEPLIRKICTNPLLSLVQAGDGGLVPRQSKRSSSTLGEYRKSVQTLFAKRGHCRLLATARSARVTKMISYGRPR